MPNFIFNSSRSLASSFSRFSASAVKNSRVTDRFSCILDLSLFRKAQAHRFLAPFLETLYRQNQEPLNLFTDEADFYAPQKPFGDEARTLGAMSDVVRRGRIRGIGCTLITQRPAVLSKDVLTQCEVLTSLRIVHHRDIAAIREWVDVHGDPAQEQKGVGSSPSVSANCSHGPDESGAWCNGSIHDSGTCGDSPILSAPITSRLSLATQQSAYYLPGGFWERFELQIRIGRCDSGTPGQISRFQLPKAIHFFRARKYVFPGSAMPFVGNVGLSSVFRTPIHCSGRSIIRSFQSVPKNSAACSEL